MATSTAGQAQEQHRPRRDGEVHSDGASSGPGRPDEVERLPLSKTVGDILEEARIILPGAQVLFGFQLVIVFDGGFREQLSAAERYLHLAAMVLIAVAIAFLIAPAVYHRRVEPEAVSRRFVRLSSRLLWWSSLPLMLALVAEVYLVASIVTGRWGLSLAIALFLLAVYVALWFVLPRRTVPVDERVST